MSQQPDILIFMSDQHTARLMGCAGDDCVETPHLDAIAKSGVHFKNAYTASPLCVPARFSFLTGRLPSQTGVLTNTNSMPSGIPTFAHSLGAAGYETVLCGRMHFCGPDQRHGFERRIMGDFTPCLPGRGGLKRDDLGPYVGTPADKWEKHFGGGEDSPVLAYDRAVVAGALEEMAKPHDRPLLLVVGTYGPHHTFVAPTDLYQKYLKRIGAPISSEDVDMLQVDRAFKSQFDGLSATAIHQIRSAYYGMIECADAQIGAVHSAWEQRNAQYQRQGLFVYLSDHGEMAGHRGLWGKMSFFDDAAKIPLIVSGDGVAKGVSCETPVSIMDLAPTLTKIAGGPDLPEFDGQDLGPALRSESLGDHPVFSECYRGHLLGRMSRKGSLKYWDFQDQGILFDVHADPMETKDLSKERPDLTSEFKKMTWEGIEIEKVQEDQQRQRDRENVFEKWGAKVPLAEPDRWKVPESSWVLPKT